MNETIVSGIFSGAGAIIGSIIGGIVALIVCCITIKSERKNKLLERFLMLCKEFKDFCQSIKQANAQPGDEASTGLTHKNLSECEKNKIIFLLAEIEKIRKQNKNYGESFFTMFENMLSGLLHIKDIVNSLQLQQGSLSIYDIKSNDPPKNKLYKLAQTLLIEFSKWHESKSK